MDADSALKLPFVTGINNRGDGTYGITYTVQPGGPYPSEYPESKVAMQGTLTDAVGATQDEWPTLSAQDVADRIAAQWVNHLPDPPAPPDTWSDGITAKGSAILTSQSATWDTAAWPPGTPITQTDGGAHIPPGATVKEVLDGSHVVMSAPATDDGNGLAFSFGETEESRLHAELAEVNAQLAAPSAGA